MAAPEPPQTANPLYDLAELGAVFEEFRPRLAAIVRRRLDPALGSRLSADDVLHEAFLDAARRWPAYRKAGTPVSPFVWLYGLVRDRLVEEYRKATRARRDARRDLPWPEETSLQLALNLTRSSGPPSRLTSSPAGVRFAGARPTVPGALRPRCRRVSSAARPTSPTCPTPLPATPRSMNC